MSSRPRPLPSIAGRTNRRACRVYTRIRIDPNLSQLTYCGDVLDVVGVLQGSRGRAPLLDLRWRRRGDIEVILRVLPIVEEVAVFSPPLYLRERRELLGAGCRVNHRFITNKKAPSRGLYHDNGQGLFCDRLWSVVTRLAW